MSSVADAVPISVLDLRPHEAAFSLAPAVEEAGFHRYWVAEHQPQPYPLLFAALAAGVTETIRVGTAGVLLHYYPPTKTAVDFQFLESCFSGRIDAGVCAGRIGNPRIEQDQLDGRDRDATLSAYEQRVTTLVRALRGQDRPLPDWPDFDVPELWIHSSGPRSCGLAARVGARLGYGLFFRFDRDDLDNTDVERYRAEFVGATADATPYVAIAVAGICARTDEEAADLAAGVDPRAFKPNVVGGPATCRARLDEIIGHYGADELVFADLCEGLDRRVACYRRLAEAMKTKEGRQ